MSRNRRPREHLGQFAGFQRKWIGITMVPQPSAASAPMTNARPLRARPRLPGPPARSNRQAESEGLDFPPKRLVIQCAGRVDDRRPVGPLTGRLGKGVEDVHWFICCRMVSTALSSRRSKAWKAAAVPAAQPVASAVPMHAGRSHRSRRCGEATAGGKEVVQSHRTQAVQTEYHSSRARRKRPSPVGHPFRQRSMGQQPRAIPSSNLRAPNTSSSLNVAEPQMRRPVRTPICVAACEKRA